MKKNLYLLIGVCLMLFGIESYAQTITRGPYLQVGTPTSMTIRWRTDIATSSRVWYGTSSSNLAFTNTISGSRTEHEVKISGLAANTTYYYAVGNTSGQLTVPGSNYYFKTSPNPGTVQTIRAWVLGDCGTGDIKQRAVRDAFYNFFGSGPLDMMLLLGDNAYEDGTDAEFQAAIFENMYENRIANTVMWPAIGNHETITASSSSQSGPYYDIFTMPKNGEAGGVASGTESYYSFDYGNIHFVVLNSDDENRNIGGPMYNWLENDLSSTNQHWKVAYFHHPPYSKDGESDSGGKETAMRQRFLPILEAHGVDLVLVGHAHNWQRSYMIHGHYGQSNTWNPATMGLDLGDGRMNGDGPYMKSAGATTPGTVYIVTGSAAKKTGPATTPHPVMYSTITEYGSMYMEVTGNQMDIKFIRETGAIDDYLTIIKQSMVGAIPTVSITSPMNGANYSTIPQPIAITADASDSDGTVTRVDFFVNGNPVGTDMQAPYSVNWTIPAYGNYTISAIAKDNNNNSSITATIQVTSGPVSVCSKVSTGNDDAEERPTGSVSLTGSDLELVNEPGVGFQSVGIRFTGLNIPAGATIMSAYMQFIADEAVNENPISLTITGQASDNAPTFASSNRNVSNRPRTAASVSWSPPDWLTTGTAGLAQRTPNLSGIIQEIVNRPGYTANSALAFIIEGTGRRIAEPYEGGAAKAPELCVEYVLYNADCPDIPANIGTPCNDGDNTTIDDVVDANCNCVGTPTACTGIGDADGDGVCANVDCDDNNANITYRRGDACNDGDNTTINDVIGANCNCAGTPTACTGIGDADGDGVCGDVDCDDNNPFITYQPGDACNDGLSTTINDIIDASCNCAGTPVGCTFLGDADGDGICADVDCNDNNASVTTQPGDPCNDGDPDTVGETIQADCSCGGGSSAILLACSQVSVSSDDAEENNTGTVSFSNSDLELATDGVPQIVGMRFNNLNIPQGAYIVSAHIQFAVDENRNDNPCNLNIYGQASDNPATFTSAILNISSRPRTAATVSWSPPQWPTVGAAGPEQLTPNIASIIQEIVNRSGYTSSSSIAVMIDGTGRRVAESYNGDPAGAPRLCVEYRLVPPSYDCPALQANIGAPCNDGDNTTINDVVGANCSCAGTATACTGIGDADGDGVCANVDCDDNNASITVQAGAACDDGDPTTINDVINANCNCAGTPVGCTFIGDVDGDGVCSDVDCNDNNAGITTQAGAPCDDGNPATVGETIQADCSCGGGSSAPLMACSRVDVSSDDAEESSAGSVSISNSDLELAVDGAPQKVGMRFNNLNIPQGAYIVSARIQFVVDENRNDDPCSLTIYGQASDNPATFTTAASGISSRPRTTATVSWSPSQWPTVGEAGPAQQTADISAIIQEIVNRSGYTSASSIVIMIEGTGRRVAESFNGDPAGAPQLCVEYSLVVPDCPALSANFGDPCDDGNPATINDVIDANCNCAGALNDCPGIGDNDGDGICADMDCNDNNAGITTMPGDPCNDGNPLTVGETIQADCSCGGGSSTPTLACSRVNVSSDDAEESNLGSVSFTNSDLELAVDGFPQIVGMRFNNLNIPAGSVITSAYLQFAVDENRNDDPCNLTIYGQASDNPATFASASLNISSRPRTTATVSWSPPQWLAVGEAGPAQKSPNIASIIQEIVNRGGYTSASAIAIIIDGTGRRVAESYNGSPATAPELCVEYLYSPPPPNRPAPGAPVPTESRVNVEGRFSPAPAAQESAGEAISPINLYPNPASRELLVTFTSAFEGEVQLQARNLNGQVVMRETHHAGQGVNTIALKELPLPDGVYFLQILAGGTIQSEKFVIQKD